MNTQQQRRAGHIGQSVRQNQENAFFIHDTCWLWELFLMFTDFIILGRWAQSGELIFLSVLSQQALDYYESANDD